ncbi:MAG: hypothetical protein AMS27_08740 [Bacteroides sp. SM23_62_1]|nr:MAG: hypothetical protein AMS27_08740 [Bacteroides sp. SM23_62_1]
MSIGWIYPIGILISYIFSIIEYGLRSYLVKSGHDLEGIPFVTIFLVSLFFIVLGIIQLFKYKNWIYPVLGFLIGLTTFQISFILTGYGDILKFTYFGSFFIIILFVIINWNSFYSHEKFEANSRRLFRLASERIYETDDGFTERPFVAGRFECSRDELLGFVRFLHGSYVIRPFYYESYTDLAFSMNTSLVVIREATEVSHIRFNYDGSITVRISEKDYRDYRERFSFDQLCTSMAMVFIRFLEYYKSGLESRIITELKSAK